MKIVFEGSLETVVSEMQTALNHLSGVASQEETVPVAKPIREKVEKAPEEKAPEEKGEEKKATASGRTKDETRDLMKKKIDVDRKAVAEALAEFGAKTFGQLKPEDYEPFCVRLEDI